MKKSREKGERIRTWEGGLKEPGWEPGLLGGNAERWAVTRLEARVRLFVFEIKGRRRLIMERRQTVWISRPARKDVVICEQGAVLPGAGARTAAPGQWSRAYFGSPPGNHSSCCCCSPSCLLVSRMACGDPSATAEQVGKGIALLSDARGNKNCKCLAPED